MSVLLNATFATDAEGFSAGSRVASEGADFSTGYLQVGAGETASKSFTAATTGTVRWDFYFNATDTETAANNTKDHIVYLLPTSGAVSSANSICAFGFGRNTTVSPAATSARGNFQYRDSTGFVWMPEFNQFPKIAGSWVKVSVIARFSGTTFDIYLNDILWVKNLTWANASAADISRVVILGNASAPNMFFDAIRVEDGYSLPTESVLIEHDFVGGTGEIEDSSPTTCETTTYAQPWKIADDATTFGAFTLGANGAAPDSAKICSAMQECRPDGILEVEFNTASSGNIYFGLVYRLWGGVDSALSTDRSYNMVRYYSAATAGTEWSHFVGGLKTDAAVQTSATPALSANTTYTVKIEMRGRYISCSYKAAAMDSGSYTTLFSGDHLIDSTADGARGQLSEEHCGFLVATTLGGTTNYARKFRFTGNNPSQQTSKTIGDRTYVVNPGNLREFYDAGVTLTQRNLFWSKGFQFGHRSRGDMGNHVAAQATLYSGTNTLSLRQRSHCVAENEWLGLADCIVTLTRRGAWCKDRVTMWEVDENHAPDFDLRGELWDKTFRHCGSSGAGSSYDDSTFHDWVSHRSSAAVPLGHQCLTNAASGNKVRMTQIILNNLNWSGANHLLTSKFIGNTDPISRAFSRQGANLVDLTAYEVGRCLLVETGSLSLSDTILTELRDDLADPMSFTATTGSLKTDATYDLNTDGFNEGLGWYEWTCSGGGAEFTMLWDSKNRYYPQFHLNGWTSTFTRVSIGGVLASAGTDYWLDDLGDGSALLQINSVLGADTAILVEAAGSSSPSSSASSSPSSTPSSSVSASPSSSPSASVSASPSASASASPSSSPSSSPSASPSSTPSASASSSPSASASSSPSSSPSPSSSVSTSPSTSPSGEEAVITIEGSGYHDSPVGNRVDLSRNFQFQMANEDDVVFTFDETEVS